LTVDEKRHALAQYRIKQAEESLEEAEFLMSGEKSPRSIINRAYFNKHFIKGGLLPEALGRSLNKAFELRQRSDYREYIEPTHEQVAPFTDFQQGRRGENMIFDFRMFMALPRITCLSRIQIGNARIIRADHVTLLRHMGADIQCPLYLHCRLCLLLLAPFVIAITFHSGK
jgi:uncharacterized protein (UPF0332 family)